MVTDLASKPEDRAALAQHIRQFIVDIDMWRALGDDDRLISKSSETVHPEEMPQKANDVDMVMNAYEKDLRSPLSVLATDNIFKTPT